MTAINIFRAAIELAFFQAVTFALFETIARTLFKTVTFAILEALTRFLQTVQALARDTTAAQGLFENVSVRAKQVTHQMPYDRSDAFDQDQ